MMPIKRRSPALGDTPDYSRALYPDPPSHDFCVWLIIAELMRRYHKAPGPLKVKLAMINGQLGCIDFGPFSLRTGQGYPCGVSREYSDTMLANVMRPAMEMIGAVEEPTVHAPFIYGDLARYVEYDYHIGHLVDAGRLGFEIPKWQVPQWAHDEVRKHLGDQRPVVVTLREAPAQPERNSRIKEWLRFAATIDGDYPVLFLRDTAKAEEPLPLPFPTWARASTNVYVRAALAQHAFVNMMVGNGPNVWCLFSAAPYLTFKQLVPELPDWAHGQPQGWKEQDHMDVGESLPWALPTQRFTWKDDTFENIQSEFEDFRKRFGK
jgi:hypothetical protein